ncbi:ribonuclease 7 [Carlito syrichta]|uniref:Ribonuclease 7 n=1 Tax=Carlito syrichta TaxID=1868482 RepID=W0UVE7_CARSF|nr:ribonuclease 7 [Carlito syrichta]CDG31998.1 TPA: ribonuclease A E1 [Carlito syrichta]
MAPVRAGFCPLLLLLLGLWVAMISVSAKPGHVTDAGWFKTQHVQNKRRSCKAAMENINKHTKHCKDRNTFLQTTFSKVAATCRTPSIACKDGQKNCHKSRGAVSMTLCEVTSGKYPNCKYKENHLKKRYIVACNPPQKGDSKKFKLVPVHLDNIL